MTLQDERPRTRLLLPDPPTSGRRRRPARATRPRRRTVAAVIVGVLLVLAAVSETIGPRRHASAPPAPQTDAPGQPATGALDVAYPNSRAGAETAATNYVVELGGADMFDAERRHGLVARIADPVVERALQQQLDAAFGAVMATFGLDERGRPPRGLTFICRVLPVGVRLVDYTGSTARVAVWTAGLVGLAGERSTKPVAAAWSTTTVSLRWTEDGWKWVSFTQQDGPTPVGGLQPPSAAADIAEAASDFRELRYAR